MPVAYIGLGSNLNNPCLQLKTALVSVKKISKTSLMTVSPFYSNPPLSDATQPTYVNAVAKLQTLLSPIALLAALQEIEQAQGRVRYQRWQSRTLDLDLLLFENEVMQTEEITLPHPGIQSRSFVIYPLLHLDENLILPDGTALKSLTKTIKNNLHQLSD